MLLDGRCDCLCSNCSIFYLFHKFTNYASLVPRPCAFVACRTKFMNSYCKRPTCQAWEQGYAHATQWNVFLSSLSWFYETVVHVDLSYSSFIFIFLKTIAKCLCLQYLVLSKTLPLKFVSSHKSAHTSDLGNFFLLQTTLHCRMLFVYPPQECSKVKNKDTYI